MAERTVHTSGAPHIKGSRRGARFPALLLGALLAAEAALSPLSAAATAQGHAPSEAGGGIRWVEFLPPWDDAAPTATDMSFLLDPPAGKHGRVVVCGEHLCFGDGTRARFWGVNLVNDDCCPPKEQAERIAAHIAKLGFNAVRFHHMSDAWYLGALIDPQLPRQGAARDLLDRFDYFVAQLERHGIYVFFSSNVHPPFSLLPNIPDGALLREGDKKFGAFTRLATIIEPTLQEQQKKFINLILNHVNPYTGTRYADDPAVAFFEVANENSLADSWNPHYGNRVDRLPPYYQSLLDRLWTEWVMAKYGNVDSALSAWGLAPSSRRTAELAKAEPQSSGFPHRGENVLQGQQPRLEIHAGALAEATRGDLPGTGTIELARAGTERWHVQWRWDNVPVVPGRKYRLTVGLRATEPRAVGIILQQAGPPWRARGLAADITLPDPGKTVEATFIFVPQPADHPYKLALTLGDAPGTVEVTRFELTSLPVPVATRAPANESSLPRPRQNDYSGFTPSMVADYVTFLADQDRAYYRMMYNHIRLQGFKGIVIGTQASSLGGLRVQSEVSDVVDAHEYWDHPRFPSTPWSLTDWRIKNLPMLSSLADSALARLAGRRVAGKPFIVSEFNAAQPNEYDAESLPLLAAVAARQDWDGVFIFHLDASPGQLLRRKAHFFDLNNHPGKLATLPLAAALYLRADALPAALSTVVTLGREPGLTGNHGTFEAASLSLTTSSRLQPESLFHYKLAIAWPGRHNGENQMAASGGYGMVKMASMLSPQPANVEMVIQKDAERATGTAVVATEKSVGWIGELTPSPYDLGRIQVRPRAHFYGVLAAVALDNNPLAGSRKVLIIAAGTTSWREARWNEERTSLSDSWAGQRPLLSVPKLEVKSSLPIRVFTLNTRGEQEEDGGISASSDRASPWYLAYTPLHVPPQR